MLSNLTCVLIYSLELEDGVKDNCSENFVIFAEKYLWESLLKEVTLCRVALFWNKVLCQIWFLRNLRNIQCHYVIIEGIINF